MLRLYTFRISHFSEKVRWALDLEGIAYTERVVPPGLHVPIIRSRAPKSTVPLLEHDGTFVQGSSAILDYVEAHLGASRLAPSSAEAKRSAELEALADRAFGLGAQRILYDVLLQDRRAMIDLWSQGSASWTQLLYAVTFPVLANAIRRTYRIAPNVVAEAKERFRRALDETDRALAGRRYLIGDERPGRADVSVAALFAPFCRPPEHVVRWPELEASTRESLSEFEGRPTWDFVLRMYREHRNPGQPSSS